MRRISIQTRHFLLLGFFFIIINTFLFQKIGVKIANDSPRYLEYSNSILTKNIFYNSHDFWYLSYIFFLTSIKLFTDNVSYIVLFQVVLSWFAVVVLYKSSLLLFKDYTIAFSTCVAYLSFIEISSWNFYVLTESFYSSIICFTIYSVIRTYNFPDFQNIILCFLLGLLSFFTKPTGIAIGIAIGSLIFYTYKKSILKTPKYLLALISSLPLFLCFLLINNMLKTFILIENYLLGEIVYGVTTLPGLQSISTLTIDVNIANLKIPDKNLSPIVRMFLFFIENPIFNIRLASLKLFWFLVHCKPYFSHIHNIFIAVLLYPMYLFFGISLTKNTINNPIKLFLISIVIVNCLIVSLTSEDWDGRFLMPILPAIFLLGTGQIILSIRRQIPLLQKAISNLPTNF
jgi:hypothetical protein